MLVVGCFSGEFTLAIITPHQTCHHRDFMSSTPWPMNTPSISRREFLKTTALAGASVTLAQFTPAVLRGTEIATPTPSWVDRPMRWAQLAFVEDDPGKFDLNFWLDYFRRTKSDGVCLS